MRLPGIIFHISLAIGLLSLAPPIVRSQTLELPPHPRLIVYGTEQNPTRLETLRALVDETGDPQQWSERKKVAVLAFRSLRAGAHEWNGRNLEAEWGEPPLHQDAQYRCLSTLALTDLLMKGKGSLYPEYADGRIYAQKANAFLHRWRDHGFHNWGQDPDRFTSENELGYAELLAGYALFYDWCYDYLSLQERAYHSRALYRLVTGAEDLYIGPYGDWRNGRFDNNHLGVIFGAAGLAALALDQENPIFDQTARDSIATLRTLAATRVSVYLDAGFPGEGACIEGVLYGMYGLNLALPYALATERLQTVTPGYDALPADMRVIGPRNAYQAPTWLYCEQLPYQPCGGTPLNDTARPPFDMNPGFRAWPWLNAFSTVSNPNLALPFFRTIYTPAAIDEAVAAVFDYRHPDPVNDPFDVQDVIDPQAECLPGELNSAGILLAWPEGADPPSLDPAALEDGMYFAGRGITYFRSDVQTLLPDGTRDWKPDSCLITFECRQHPAYPPGYLHWNGHTQQDVNHFTVFFAGEPLFYDSGYSGFGGEPAFHSLAHSLHQVRIGTGAWGGFSGDGNMGAAIGAVIGAGSAPSFAGGINTECWAATSVERSVRRIVVLPRTGAVAPYFLLHDDFQLTANGRIRARMQTANEYEGSAANMPSIADHVARWDKGDARAVLAFLSPAGMSLTTPYLVPNDSINWPPHWIVQGEVPVARTRHQLVSMVEPRFVSDESPELLASCVSIATSDPEGLAYQIDSGTLTDIVAFRPYDRTGDWWIYPQGFPAIEAHEATMFVVRFEDSSSSIDEICAGMLGGAGALHCEGRLVAALEGDRGSSLTFSEEAISIWTDQGERPRFYVRGIAPARVVVNGKPLPASLAIMQRPAEFATGDGEGPARSTPHPLPNPLRAGMEIRWSARGGPVTIDVYDVAGRLMRTIEPREADGEWRLRWDGRAGNGEALRTGLYLFRVREGDAVWSRRVLVIP